MSKRIPPPGKVVIGPHVFKVVSVPNGVLDDAGRYGHTALPRNLIALDDGMPFTQEADTLCHESAHGMLATIDLGEDEAVEERVCLILGPALLGWVRNNPDLIAYLLQDNPDE